MTNNYMRAHTQLIRHITLCLGIITALLLSVIPAQAQHPISGGMHYIVLETSTTGSITPIYAQTVAASPPLGLDAASFNARMSAPAPRQSDQLGLTLLDANNQPLYYTITESAAWTRGDFHGHNGTIDGVLAANTTRYAVARVPAGLGERLAVNMTGAGTNQRSAPTIIDLNTLPMTGNQRTGQNMAQIQQDTHGDPANRVDLLVIGDGYTAAQQNKFNADVNQLMNGFFSITPYAQYRPYFNVTRLFVPSAQSGADHPPYDPNYTGGGRQPARCTDPAAATNPLAGRFVDTALNASYCGNGVHRLLLVDIPLTLAAAATYPEWDEILVIVNDPTYGGSGGTFGVFSTAPQVVQIAQHEFGHTFTGLADTYETPYPGYPACSDINTSTTDDCEPNVTDQTDRSAIKWAHWLHSNTPTPTAEQTPSAPPTAVGLYPGARFRSHGMYRSSDTSLMRELDAAFNPVENEAFVRRLYNGWPGADGINPIDAVTPANTNPLTLTTDETQTFHARLLAPIGGPGVQAVWSVNGQTVNTVQNTTQTAYTFTPTAPGRYTIRLDVTDLTPLLQNHHRPTQSQSWEVYVGTGGQDGPTAGVYFTQAATTIDETAQVVYVDVDLFVQVGNAGGHYPSPVTVTLDLSGTASNDDDFTVTPTVTFERAGGFPAGVYSQRVAVHIHDDGTPEDAETLTLQLREAGAEVAVYDFAAHTITINMSNVNRQPTDLLTTLDALPADTLKRPDFTWRHQMLPSQTDAPASWYRVVMQRDGVTVVDRWYEAATICTGVTCSIAHPDEDLPHGLSNGYYRWWVGGYLSADEMIWSQPGTFLMDEAPPAPPSAVTVAPNQGRPTLSWAASPRAAWYQVYIGGETPYLQWHAADDLCIDGTCTLNPVIDRTAGTYAVWMQAWGPPGFSSADGSDGAHSWVQAADLVLSDTPPTLPTGIAFDNASSANPAITWAAGTGATWYHVVITTADYTWTQDLGWHLSTDLGCGAPAQTCLLNDTSLHNGLLDMRANTGDAYEIYIRAWGPGGFSNGSAGGYTLGTVMYTYGIP